MIERIVFLSALLAGSFLYPFMTAQTGGSEVAVCESADGETDNKIREMANETYINRVKTSDKHQ